MSSRSKIFALADLIMSGILGYDPRAKEKKRSNILPSGSGNIAAVIAFLDGHDPEKFWECVKSGKFNPGCSRWSVK